jgi:hypothetical protein
MSPPATATRFSAESVIGRARLASPSVALVLGGVTFLFLVAVVPLSVVAHQFTAVDVLPVLVTVPFAGVGVLVAYRQPRNPIGWILLLLALVVTVGGDAGFYSLVAYRVEGHSLPLSRLAVALAPGWIALIVLLPLPILLFPDGRLPGQLWRWTLWAYVVVVATFVIAIGITDAAAFTDRRIQVDSTGELASLGSNTSPGPIAAGAENVLFLAYALIGLLCVTRQLMRYRRSRGDDRQQLKWLISGGAIGIVGFVEALVLSNARSTLWQVVSGVGYMGVAGLPLGIGVGILKYRLYEIDRLIRRTISYTLVTGVLSGVFVGLVLLTTRALPLSSPVGVAASTLAAAALFNPLRRSTQRLADRRFNRSRYDTEKAIVDFTARFRDAVDVDTVRTELLDTVNRAIAPTHASLWIKQTRSASRGLTKPAPLRAPEQHS